ncbi:MAG: class I SAM-dependent methyltransferase [Pseudomonadota bacterium]
MATLSSDQTRNIYETQAALFDAQRSRALFEARWLACFSACLPIGGRVLDLGCGAGEPIARWFIAEGFQVTGVDFAVNMLQLARARWPDGDWRQADMRDFELSESFDGIVAWDSLFHLTPSKQRTCIARMARHLSPGGSILATVGAEAGEAEGEVAGNAVYHASLSPAQYAMCLEENELRLTGYLAEDPETQKHSVLMARKI